MNGGLSMVEMKSGYKMTEVGVIPEDWEVKELSSISAIKSGKRLPKGSLVTSSKTPYPYIRVIDMNMGYLNLSNIMYVPENVQPMISKYIISKNDIYISVAGTLGLVGKIPEELDGANLTENANRITEIQCNRDYLMYYMMSPLIQNVIEAERTIGAQPKLALQRIRDFYIVLPRDKREQAAIATALSDVDSLISALTKKIEKKKAIKQGLMQQLLTGKKRLPGYEKNREPVQTEWGAIPKDWKTLSIGKCCSIKARIGWQGLKKSEYLSSGEYVLVTGTDFLNGRIDWKSCVYVSKKRYEQDTNIQIVKHDILITKDGTIGKVAFLDDVPCLGTLNSGIFVVRSHSEELDQCYLSKIFESFIFDAFLESLVAGSTINHLYQKDFVHFNFPVPPTMSEQTAIANILSDCDSEIAALEEKRDKYKEIKQGMMQQLLTGKIRLIK